MSKIASLKLTNRFYVLGHTLDKANLSYNRPFHQLLLLLGNEARVLFNQNDHGHGTNWILPHFIFFTAFRKHAEKVVMLFKTFLQKPPFQYEKDLNTRE